MGSPIEKESARFMTNDQWLRAIEKYDSDDFSRSFDHPERGGALELARMLQEFTQEQPMRFAQLALQIPEESHHYYFSHVIRGLADSTIPSVDKLKVIRRVLDSDSKDCIQAALNLISSLKDVELPDDVTQFIQRMAEHSDPIAESWNGERPYYGGDILTHGINCVRGNVAETIRSLLFYDETNLTIFAPTIEKLVSDPSLAVRACAASTLIAVTNLDFEKALQWGDVLLSADERLLATTYVQKFIIRGLPDYFKRFESVIHKMLCAEHEKVRTAGGTIACLARLYHTEADYLSEKALKGDEYCRLGACEVAKSNLLNIDCREWCEFALRRLFDDDDKKVRQNAAGCFWNLWQSPDTPLKEFDELIDCFLKSASFTEEPTFLLHAFEENNHQLPDIVIDICSFFIERCGEEAKDIRTSMAADEMTVGKLVFTAYAQLQSLSGQNKALDLIDQMSIEGLSSAKTHLTEFER